MPTEAQLREILRYDLVYYALGVIILTVAVLSLLEAILSRPRQRLVFLFGIVGLLYGTRLFLQIRTFGFIVAISPLKGREIWAVLNYLIPIGGIYLWSFFVSPRSRKWIYIAVAVHTVFAAIGIPHDLITRNPWQPPFPQINSALVISSSLLTAVLIILDIAHRYIPLDVTLRSAGLGFVAFQFGVLYDNLVPLRVVPEVWTEPFAFTAFLFGMGYAVRGRLEHDRNRLVTMQAEMDQARRIQMSILPPGPPLTPHYQIAARYSPMTSVAGDLYDFVTLADGRLGLFIADVSGHGLPAALIASMLKTAVNLQAPAITRPSELLTELNRVFCGQSHGQFVTAAFAILDAKSQSLAYSAAGHPPLLLCKSGDGEMKEIEENGLPLGILPGAQYSDVTVPFAPGDRLAMYTDGIVESENALEEEFGRDRLSAILQEKNGSAADLLGNAMLAVERWHGATREQSDDLTLLIAEHL
jgi:phosphoserine phosphatase RsbU/P